MGIIVLLYQDGLLPPNDAINMSAYTGAQRAWCSYGTLDDSVSGEGINYVNAHGLGTYSYGWYIATLLHS